MSRPELLIGGLMLATAGLRALERRLSVPNPGRTKGRPIAESGRDPQTARSRALVRPASMGLARRRRRPPRTPFRSDASVRVPARRAPAADGGCRVKVSAARSERDGGGCGAVAALVVARVVAVGGRFRPRWRRAGGGEAW